MRRDLRTLGILAEPPQGPLMGRCDKCRRWFALKLVRTEQSVHSGALWTYRCKHCGHEEQYVKRHPRGVI
jgi:hypothetical protein